jgi:hypothetical protein
VPELKHGPALTKLHSTVDVSFLSHRLTLLPHSTLGTHTHTHTLPPFLVSQPTTSSGGILSVL